MIARLRLLLEAAAALLVAGLVLVTSVDVVGRYFLNRPMMGAFEVTQVLLGALVFVALPLTTAKGGHVEVDLLVSIMPARVSRILARIGGAVMAVVLLYFAFRLVILTEDLMESNKRAPGLELPLWALGVVGVLSCTTSAIVAVLRREP